MNANIYILVYKHDGVIEEYAKAVNIPRRAAFDTYYKSVLYSKIRDGISDMHCRSDGYLAEELLREVNRTSARQRPLPERS